MLDARVRAEHGKAAYSDTAASQLAAVEKIFGEPSDTGLAAKLQSFWTAWGTLGNNPDSTSARALLLSSADGVAATLHTLSGSLGASGSDVSASLADDLAQANTAAQRLATVNAQVAVGAATGQNVNALLDQRDQALTTLSSLVGAQATIAPNGTASVSVAGQPLVGPGVVSTLTLDSSHQVSVGGSPVSLTSGSAAARVTALVTTLPGYQARLDAVANALAAAGNAIQAAGYDSAGAPGTALFSGAGAAGITVAITDPAALAAASTPGRSLDGSNAVAGSQYGGRASSPDIAYAGLVGDAGAASAAADQAQQTQAAVAGNVDALKASVSGVSYDEELSTMLTYQHAFSASSRVLTTIDQMLDTLINHTGVVGQA